MLRDIRLAFRLLWLTPVHTGIALLSIAFSVGARPYNASGGVEPSPALFRSLSGITLDLRCAASSTLDFIARGLKRDQVAAQEGNVALPEGLGGLEQFGLDEHGHVEAEVLHRVPRFAEEVMSLVGPRRMRKTKLGT